MASPCWYWSFVFGIRFPIPIAPSWLGRGAQRQADQGSRCLSAVKRSEFSETPLGSSTAGCPGAKRRGPRLRVAFLLGTFLWRSKEKCLARRGETRPATLRREKGRSRGREGKTARRTGARPGLLPLLISRQLHPKNTPFPLPVRHPHRVPQQLAQPVNRRQLQPEALGCALLRNAL